MRAAELARRRRRARATGGVRAPGPSALVDVDPDYERKAAARQRKLAREFAWSDGQYPEVRQLIGFYGSRPVGEALMYRNPRDVPAYLGRVDEYRAWCEGRGV